MAGCLVNHPPAYVFDTGPLSHFARGGWLGALEFLVGDSSAWIPEAVARELTDGQHQHQHLGLVLTAAWLGVDRSDDMPVLLRTARYEQRLAAGGRNHGECAVLALAAVRGWTAVIDDSEARKIAHEDSIDYTTTVRLLCQAISAGKMTATSCAAIVDALVRTEYRLPFDSGQDFLRWASREGIVDYEATRAEGE
jgi:predicted nucleic acid-binding protein